MIPRTDALAQLGRALGDLRWVQGPGGNVSMKARATLHVKASGTRLSDIGGPGTLATVPLELAYRALDGDPVAGQVMFERTPRPSLETWFHALPGRYIVHTHPLAVLLMACTAQALPADVVDIAPALPGRDVALAMQAAGDTRVWVLRNHGLCVRASSASGAVRLSRAVAAHCAALAGVSPRHFPRTPLFVPVVAPGAAWTPLSPRPWLSTPTYLFPDAAVLAAVRLAATLDDTAVIAALAADPRPGVLHALDGRRVAFARTPGQLRDVVEVVTAHDWLLDMLGDSAVPLPSAMVHAIVDMPAEKFRQAGRAP